MTTKPNIIRGGKAINIGKRLYYIDGKPHELGGVDIGKNLEVEGGEVVEVKDKGLRVYSAQPILNGTSPAKLVMGGIEPDVIFNAQERFKDMNNLNDDGSKKKKMGGLSRSKDYGSKKKPYPNVNKKDFAGGGRSYPIPTKADAIDALKLAGLHGRSDVKAKVYRKYPELKKRVGGTINVNGNVVNKLLFTSSSTGDKKRAKLGTGEPGENPPIVYTDTIVPPIYGMPTIGSVRRFKYPDPNILKIISNPIYNNKSNNNYPSIDVETPAIKYYNPILVRKNNSIDSSIEGIDYNYPIYPNANLLRTVENSPNSISPIELAASGKMIPNKEYEGNDLVYKYTDSYNDLNDANPAYIALHYDDPSNLKVDTTPYAPYQWDDTQFSITPGSISRAETNRNLRGDLGNNGGYDPIEEGILQIRELGTGQSGTPEGFVWRNYTDPSSDESIVNRIPRSRNTEQQLLNWGFTPNKIYKTRRTSTSEQISDEEPSIETSGNNSSNAIPRRRSSNNSNSSTIPSRTIAEMSSTPIGFSKDNTINLPTPNIDIEAIRKNTNDLLAKREADELVRGSFKGITPEDWISLGSNLASSIGSYFVGRNRPSIDLVEPSKPIMQRPTRMVTTYNNRPEVANIEETVKRSIDDIAGNTSSSRTALQRMQRVRNAGTQAINESETRKENIEIQLRNADAVNRQSVNARNISTYNKWLADRQNIRNRQRILDAENRSGRLQNTIDLFTNVNATLQDLLSRLEQRRKFNNTLGYLQSTAPNVDDRIMRDNGVNFNYLRTIGG